MSLINLTINHRSHFLEVREDETLLEVLRTHLRIGADLQSCQLGVCGSCTVIMNGAPRQVCKVRAVDANHAKITTSSGFAYQSSQPVMEMECIGLCKTL